jgi:hypothetical protein
LRKARQPKNSITKSQALAGPIAPRRIRANDAMLGLGGRSAQALAARGQATHDRRKA